MSDENVKNDIQQLLEEMKSEHEQLFLMVGKVRNAISGQDIETAKFLLLELQDFQQLHFENELVLMREYDYPLMGDHKKKHDILIESMHVINRVIHAENLQHLNRELSDYLENSIQHITEVDRPFQEFLLKARIRAPS